MGGWVVEQGNQSKGYASFHMEVDTWHELNFSYMSGIMKRGIQSVCTALYVM